VRADAQLARTLPASFDALTSRFGVMFFSDPAAAFANLAAALRPGGRVVFACWQPLSENTWMSLALAAASEHVPMPPPADPRAPGPFAFGDEHYVRACLSEAGLEQIDLTNHRSPMSLGGPIGLDGAVDFSLQLGPASRLLRDADAALRERVRAAVRNALAPHETPDGVILGSAIWLASARRPLA
jgi:SAM-dependent methyltransferase